MNQNTATFLFLLLVNCVSMTVGVIGVFFAPKIVAARLSRLKDRNLLKFAEVLVSVLRILSLVVIGLSVYLFYGLGRVSVCVFK